jgi:hypothetical protein
VSSFIFKVEPIVTEDQSFRMKKKKNNALALPVDLKAVLPPRQGKRRAILAFY